MITRRATRIQPTHHWRALLIALLLLLLLPTVARAQANPDLPTYTAWVREAYAAAQRRDTIGLRAAVTQLADATAVTLPGGTTATPDATLLVAAIAVPEPDFDAITERLGAQLTALSLPDGAAPADAEARLKTILGSAPFRQESTAPNWLGQLLTDFFNWLDRWLVGTGVASPAVGNPVVAVGGIIGGVLLLGLLLYLLRGLRRSSASEASLPAASEEQISATEALDQASELARGGDYRSAMRYLYLGALLALDERGALRYDRSLTNREYLTQLREQPALRDQLAPVVETFDRVWYGTDTLDANTFARYREQVERLQRGA